MKVDVTVEVFARLKEIALKHYGSLAAEYSDMLHKFIKLAPWAAYPALDWKPAPCRKDQKAVAVDVALPSELQEMLNATMKAINETAEGEDVTHCDFVRTAIMWWTEFVYPPRRHAMLH